MKLLNRLFTNKISNLNKKLILVISDFIIIAISIILSYSLRLEKIYPYHEINIKVYLIYYVIFFSTFYYFNIYKILLRYFDYFSIKIIIKATLFSQILLIIINFFIFEKIFFPRSISFMAPILIGILVIIHRIILNFWISSEIKKPLKENHILIIGVNEITVNLFRQIRQFNKQYGEVVCFIDVSNNYKKREINGVKIYKDNYLFTIIEKYKINEIIIGTNNYSKIKIKKIYEKLEGKNVRVRNINETKNFFKNSIKRSFKNKLNFFDIIDRPAIQVDQKNLKKKIIDNNILITGAGGSIGSELCLEIIKHSPKKIFVLDISEINLFNLLKRLDKKNKKKIIPILGDCSDNLFLSNYFKNININQIYHSAAYKHVGFGELNPYSMIKNNILGTKNLIEFALNKKIKNFIFISTDKAVKPKSILGITKQYGEKLIQSYHSKNKSKKSTKFTIVRFGNVIGSSGSVIPIFLDQIKDEKALTVTSKTVTRYFMSIKEAVQLVITASSFNDNGVKIYALEMGKQIKIYDIAKKIIILSGYTVKNNKTNKGDIEIKITGLKKGEKNSEEVTLGKKLIPTNHPKIRLCEDPIYNEKLQSNINLIIEKLKSKNFNFKDLKKILFN
jgi:FlaA1/EpsC-like NDP-sugar epimerase